MPLRSVERSSMPEEPVAKEAAPTRSRRGTGRGRIGGQVLIAALVGILGFAVTVQVNHDDQEAGYGSLRGVELVEMLKSIDAANERLATQIDDLTATRDELLSSQDRSAEAREQAEKNADRLAVLAGSVGAEGPGVRLLVRDADGEVDAGLLLDVVEELRAAGAEAIVINDTARVVAQTYFLDDEEGVRVGGREISAPYVVSAIGDPDTLQEALTFRGGVIDRIRSRGAEASVTTVEKLTVTALADVKSPEYARPDISGSDAATP